MSQEVHTWPTSFCCPSHWREMGRSPPLSQPIIRAPTDRLSRNSCRQHRLRRAAAWCMEGRYRLKHISFTVNANPRPLTERSTACMRWCCCRACPSACDEFDTPDMSEVARIAWAGTQTIRWPQQTELELSWLRSIIRHTRTRVSPPSRFLYCFTVAHTGRRRATLGKRKNGIGHFRQHVQDFSCSPSRHVQYVA